MKLRPMSGTDCRTVLELQMETPGVTAWPFLLPRAPKLTSEHVCAYTLCRGL